MEHLVQHVVLGRLIVGEEHLELLALIAGLVDFRLEDPRRGGFLLLDDVVDLQGPIETGAGAHVEHAAAEDEEGAVEAVIGDEALDQHGKDEAAGRGAGDADAVGQGPVLVEVLRDQDYAGGRREAAAYAYGEGCWIFSRANRVN